MRRPAVFWGASITGLALIDYWCDRNNVVGDTCSEVTRATFRVDTPAGRTLFTCLWAGFSWWFHRHITRR